MTATGATPPAPADHPQLLAQLTAEGWTAPADNAGGQVLESPCARVRLAVRDLAQPAHTTCELHGPGAHALLFADFSRLTPLAVITAAARAAARRTWDAEPGDSRYLPAAAHPADAVAELGFSETRREEDYDGRLLEAVYTHPGFAGSAHYFPSPDGESWWVCGPDDTWQACGGQLATGRVIAAMLTATRLEGPHTSNESRHREIHA